MVLSSLKKKPRRLMILGHEVTVSYRKLSGTLTGYFESDPPKIVIKAGAENWRTILNHEILHAILCFSGQGERLDSKEEEAIVKAIEYGLSSFLIL